MSETVFEIKDLVKEYPGVTAIDHVSSSIKKGEAVFIVGPSGSGKSTFLRSLNLLENPTSGEILFKGKSITGRHVNINKFRQQVGMVFQHFNLFPHLTIQQNITLAPVLTGKLSKSQAIEKADMLLKRIGLYEKTDEKSLVFVVVMQTIAANLGSMLTPIGNPQTLFIYSYYAWSCYYFYCRIG